MKIGVDGNLLCGKRTGMGSVVYNVLKYWKFSEKYHIVVFFPEMPDKDCIRILEENKIEYLIFGKSNYFKWEQIVLPKAVKKESIDVLWCPYNTAPIHVKCRTVVTIHDAIFFENPISYANTLYKKMGIVYRKLVVPVGAKHAERIITVSRYAEQSILKYLPEIKNKITMIYNGVDFEMKCCEKWHSPSDAISQKYILGYGSLERRKNTFGLIRAYEMLPDKIRKEYQLVLFGFKDYKNSSEEEYINKHDLNILLLGFVSEDEKKWLYSNCTMFAFPSISEGFGIPVLEAFSAGVPVITSDSTSLAEVAGNAAWLIDPEDFVSIKEAMIDVLNNPLLVSEKKEIAYKQLKNFSWVDSAKKILDIVLEVGNMK